MVKKIILLWIFWLAFLTLAGGAVKPGKIYGVYVSIWTMNYAPRCEKIIREAKEHSINTLVCDFNGINKVYLKNFKLAKEKDFYCIARIVVFEEGIGANFQTAQDQVNWQKKLNLAKEAEKLGFDEIQLDYIRFADAGTADIRKKQIVEKFLREAKAAVSIPVGVDVFGSVAYQPHPLIGQDLHRMADIIDVVSPMLYPSHFLEDPKRMAHPYETVLEGSVLAKRKIGGRNVRMVPFIQGFAMSLSYSGLSLRDYIKAQIKAVEDAGTDGFYIWHAGNDYHAAWEALRDHGSLFSGAPKDLLEVKKIVAVNKSSHQELNSEIEIAKDIPARKTIQVAESTPAAQEEEPEQPNIISLITFGML